MIKIWVDDTRMSPNGYIWVRSVKDAKKLIRHLERVFSNEVIRLSLDHDAGIYVVEGGDYIKVLDWMEHMFFLGKLRRKYEFHIHSKNSAGRQNLRKIIEHNNWTTYEEDL